MGKRKYIVETGNWKASVMLSDPDDNPQPYMEAATLAIEYITNKKEKDSNFDIIGIYDGENKNIFDETVNYANVDLPDETFGVITVVYEAKDADDDMLHRYTRTSTLFANAGMYTMSQKMIDAETKSGGELLENFEEE